MIKAEVWQAGKGSRPMYRLELPVAPTEGDEWQFPDGKRGNIWRVTWVMQPKGTIMVRISVDIGH